MNERSIEIDPQAFQAAREKKIEAMTSTDHVFVGDAVTNLNLRSFDSSEKFAELPSKFIEPIVGTTPSERMKVDLQSSHLY